MRTERITNIGTWRFTRVRYPEDKVCQLHPATAYRIKWYFDELDTPGYAEHFQYRHACHERIKEIVEQVAPPSLELDLMRDALESDGPFAGYVFLTQVQRRVSEQLGQMEERERAAIEASILRAFRRPTDLKTRSYIAVSEIAEGILRQTASAALTDPESFQRLNLWVERFGAMRECVICGNPFRLSDLDYDRYRFGRYIDCCFECEIRSKPNRKKLIKLIPSFVDACGFIPPPSSIFTPDSPSFMFRMPPERWPGAIHAWRAMGGYWHPRQVFGTWFQAFAEAGVLPNGVMVTSRGYRCKATDGHMCSSLDEQLIDNFLLSKGVRHEREPRYPQHPVFNPTGKRRADWLIGNTYVEYFGLAGDPAYDAKTEEKCALAVATGLSFLPVFPQDLRCLDEVFKSLLPGHSGVDLDPLRGGQDGE